jgi:Ni,Fe-hydrogenase III small subunit
MRNPLNGMLSLKRRTLRYDGQAPPMPERYRGRPGGPVDLGECLFSPEESAGEESDGLRYTLDPRMASRSREGLRIRDQEFALAEALGTESRRLFGRSLRLRSVSAGSCGGCEVELVALSNVVFDLARFGVDFVASPRHADGIVLTGAVSRNMEAALRETYDAVSDPRLVIAVGACAISGGPFRGSPELADAARDRLPVDLYLPGCPPHPLTVLDGLLRLLGRLKL